MDIKRASAPALHSRLEKLYSPPAAVSSPKVHSVKAAVLDIPIAASSADTEDVVYIAQAVLERLCPTCCTWVDLTNTHAWSSSGERKRNVRVKLVPVPEPPIPGSVTAVGIPPMVAHNLGLTYQLQPFMTTGSAGSGLNNTWTANPTEHQHQSYCHTPTLYPLQLRPVAEDSHSTTTVSATSRPKDHSSSRTVRVAQSVTICKVAQPVVTPFVAATSSRRDSSLSSNGNSSRQQGTDSAGTAEGGGGGGMGEAGQLDEAAATSRSNSNDDELLQQLQNHFTRQRR